MIRVLLYNHKGVLIFDRGYDRSDYAYQEARLLRADPDLRGFSVYIAYPFGQAGGVSQAASSDAADVVQKISE